MDFEFAGRGFKEIVQLKFLDFGLVSGAVQPGLVIWEESCKIGRIIDNISCRMDLFRKEVVVFCGEGMVAARDYEFPLPASLDVTSFETKSDLFLGEEKARMVEDPFQGDVSLGVP